HMVLQADQPVPVWGWSQPGDHITVRLADQSVSAVTDEAGRWQVTLKPLQQSKQPQTMTVDDGKQTLTLEDILIGQLWLCGGQSNMLWGLRSAGEAVNEFAHADHPMMRLFLVTERYRNTGPLRDIQGEWMLCKPQNVPDFSAVGYFFGRSLQQAMNCPVG